MRSTPNPDAPLPPLTTPATDADHYVAFGRVVDVRGRPIDGGEVLISRLEPDEYQRSRSSGGRFELRVPRGLGPAGAFSWRGADGRTSQMVWPRWKHNDVEGPFELVARDPSRVTVRVTLPDGSPAAGGTIYVTGPVHGHRVARQLDEAGEVTWDAPPLHMWVDARTADERFRVTKGVTPPEGVAHLVEISLVGPWVPIDLSVTSTDETLAGEEVRVSVSHGPCRNSAKVFVGDAPVAFWVPPPISGEAASIDLRGKWVVPQHVLENWERVLPVLERTGLRMHVTPLAQLTARFVHPDGRPITHFVVVLGNHQHVTDERGQLSLRVPMGGLAIFRGQLSLTVYGQITVTEREQTTELTVEGLSEIGGPFDGPTPHNPFLNAVTVTTENGRKFRGKVFEEEKRWHAWVAASVGAPVTLTVDGMLRNWAEPAKGKVGDLEVPLTVRAGWLKVRPVVGKHRAPVGHLRVTGVDVEYGNNVQIAPSSPFTSLRPIPLGTYRFAWSTDGGKTWIDSEQRVKVGEEPVDVEVVFPAKR
ncbi:MAG: hypothetical protein QNJ98_20215 [Planctomycetota bacterium]|nr:hypothetical protein [Planctomycetota bacterium]